MITPVTNPAQTLILEGGTYWLRNRKALVCLRTHQPCLSTLLDGTTPSSRGPWAHPCIVVSSPLAGQVWVVAISTLSRWDAKVSRAFKKQERVLIFSSPTQFDTVPILARLSTDKTFDGALVRFDRPWETQHPNRANCVWTRAWRVPVGALEPLSRFPSCRTCLSRRCSGVCLPAGQPMNAQDIERRRTGPYFRICARESLDMIREVNRRAGRLDTSFVAASETASVDLSLVMSFACCTATTIDCPPSETSVLCSSEKIELSTPSTPNNIKLTPNAAATADSHATDILSQEAPLRVGWDCGFSFIFAQLKLDVWSWLI